ncbi:MAG TPA: hypothetical protein VMJ70_15855 [Candidatus Sulfotelmatobacter sp.]|nr:hypothetical protein [Candidatus Sulfotelmatobacter sp.]
MNARIAIAAVLGLTALTGVAGQLRAYPGGTPRFTTNANTYCAGCHSSVGADQLRDQPADIASSMTVENRHYASIQGGQERYGKLSEDDRKKLLDTVKAMDANSKVEIAASATTVKALGTLTVTVTTHGGAGPVVGVMLTDNDLRFESSPVQTEGFLITKAPDVTGPDGKPQTAFLDGRYKDLQKNINYVNVQGVKSDPSTNTYPTCKVVYTLQAPSKPGTYTVTAAFLYGTENASPIGRQETPDGRVLPAGGGGGASGRIQFAKTLTITVS